MTGTINDQVVQAFLARVDKLSEQDMAAIIGELLDDRELLLDIRQARLAEVAALESVLIEKGWLKGPTTSECRKIAKGKM